MKLNFCIVCDKSINNYSKGKFYPLTSSINNVLKYAHAGCKKCVICKKLMSDKKSKIRNHQGSFWHSKCCKCKCGCADPEKFYLTNGEIKHRNCEYIFDNCVICEKNIQIHNKCSKSTCDYKNCDASKCYKNNKTYVHIECTNKTKCYICKKCLDVKNYDFEKTKFGFKHENCSDEPCFICDLPIYCTDGYKVDKTNKYQKLHNDCYNKRYIEHKYCKNKLKIDPCTWFSSNWTTTNHKYFPSEVKKEIKTVLMIYNRNRIRNKDKDQNKEQNVFNILNKDSLNIIFGFIATSNNRKTIAGYKSSESCTVVRCINHKICKLCKEEVNWIEKGPICKSSRCKKYNIECKKCESLIPHNINKYNYCTRFRCINDKIDINKISKNDIYKCSKSKISYSIIFKNNINKIEISFLYDHEPEIIQIKKNIKNNESIDSFYIQGEGDYSKWYIDCNTEKNIGTLVYKDQINIVMAFDVKSLIEGFI